MRVWFKKELLQREVGVGSMGLDGFQRRSSLKGIAALQNSRGKKLSYMGLGRFVHVF